MILGVHNMVEALSHYSSEHLTSDGNWWILALDGILLIPLIFAVFFFPMAVFLGVGAAVALALGFAVLAHALHTHRQRIGH